MDQPADFSEVRASEALRRPLSPGAAAAAGSPQAVPSMATAAEAEVCADAPPLIGLALSGGGIRSATFSLGVLQALAQKRLLDRFDYLSTVSGGGYIGSWLSAWIWRRGIGPVQQALGRTGSTAGDNPRTTEATEVAWLRRYSNYLAPRVGLLSTDTLTLMSIFFRNVLLNLVVVLSFTVTCLLLPRLALPAAMHLRHDGGWLIVLAGALGLVVLPVGIGFNLLYVADSSRIRHAWILTTPGVAATVLLPGVLAALAAALSLFGAKPYAIPLPTLVEACLGALVFALLIWGVLALLKKPLRPNPVRSGRFEALRDGVVFALSGMVALAFAIALLTLERRYYSAGEARTVTDYARLLAFGPPCILVTFGLSGFVYVGLVGSTYLEHSREWWSRLNAWFFVIGTGWFLVMASAYYVPALVAWCMYVVPVWGKSLIAATGFGGIVAALLGPRVKTLSDHASRHLASALNVVAHLIIIGFLMTVSAVTARLLDQYVDLPHQAAALCELDLTALQGEAAMQLAPHVSCAMVELDAWFTSKVYGIDVSYVSTAAVALMLLVFGWRVDVNKFSLHNMYKNRLIRCYLGASHADRKEQPFTGFDEDDDFALSRLADKQQRPLHILNTTLNLAQGKNLAWQERKGASFAFTPLYCGFSLGGSQGDSTDRPPTGSAAAMAADGAVTPGYAYRPTARYGGRDEGAERGFTLGMAMATSGAAASPNMGAASQPALAFVMTLFNARLGRWSANPRGLKWMRSTPKFGLYLFLQELFGLSNESRNFVYLSDGGHFENLGVYELVRRRCTTIVVVDAAADPLRQFADLGRAIRQCRVDFGVQIELPVSKMLGTSNETLPEKGFEIGSIDYGNGRRGQLIYIKPTICRGCEEPNDVLAYAAREPEFPQQTTADQFFDESQFESYRSLGESIGRRCIAEWESVTVS
jgi:Patatin-like phospholipase